MLCMCMIFSTLSLTTFSSCLGHHTGKDIIYILKNVRVEVICIHINSIDLLVTAYVLRVLLSVNSGSLLPLRMFM